MKKGSVAGKRKRKTDFNANIRELTIKQCDGKKKRVGYKSGMAIGDTVDVTVGDISRCTYYPLCTATESHSTARSKLCDFNLKSPTERKMALKRLKTMYRKGVLEKE